MALKLAAPFPLFSPAPLPSRRGGAATELHFSRWNNANAEPFLRRQREQQAIEADIRLHRRHLAASRLAEIAKEPPLPPAPDFKSLGTPSAPSPPSIPGKASKYSKPPQKPPQKPKNSSHNPSPQSHPAFRRVRKEKIIPVPEGESGISVSKKGVSYKIEGAPFEFQYSYTETPRVKPVALREPPFLPFGPGTTPRPWTGRAPLPASKKKLPEFDSFKLPPPGKKGVKPVQAPGPFLAGSGPRYKAASREEILGEPLTEEEVKDLVRGCLKTRRQLNMGRDGLTHNMLDNIHAHWKRRRVCKIKCKGVCTVDMDNVCQQLEEKTGGKIIYSRGGVIFLFRGRNYNYKTRPRFPLMLWRPVTPVYPRLIQRVPEGLTLEEVTEMRKRGRQLPPICKLAKNGLYSNLVKHVREAFEACELVRVNCKDLNKSDCRKIGAKLKDLVPCVLISFEYEHILLWRGKDWKSSLLPPEDDLNKVAESAAVASATISSTTDSPLNHKEEPELESGKSEIDIVDLEMTVVGNDNLIAPDLCAEKSSIEHLDCEIHIDNMIVLYDVITEVDKNLSNLEPIKMSDDATASLAINQLLETPESGARKSLNEGSCFDIPSQSTLQNDVAESGELEDLSPAREAQLLAGSSIGSNIIVTDRAVTRIDGIGSTNVLEMLPKERLGCQACLDGVMFLLMQAVENGSAVIMDNESLDADMVFDRSVALAKTAPPEPIFQHKVRKVQVKNTRKKNAEKEMDEEHKENDVNLDLASISDVSEKRVNEKRKSKGRKREDFRGSFSDVVPHGSLRVDELAKLLA